jgi:hypothetical protein
MLRRRLNVPWQAVQHLMQFADINNNRQAYTVDTKKTERWIVFRLLITDSTATSISEIGDEYRINNWFGTISELLLRLATYICNFIWSENINHINTKINTQHEARNMATSEISRAYTYKYWDHSLVNDFKNYISFVPFMAKMSKRCLLMHHALEVNTVQPMWLSILWSKKLLRKDNSILLTVTKIELTIKWTLFWAILDVRNAWLSK